MKINTPLSLFGIGLIASSPPSAQATQTLVDLELSLLTDISGSVSNSEYQLMIDGYAAAFRNVGLQNAITNGNNGGIAVNLVFFDSSAVVGIPFTYIDSPAAAENFATAIDNIVRPSFGGTNPSAGLLLSDQTFATNNFDSNLQIIDIAGDGQGNTGIPAAQGSSMALLGETDIINAIAVGDPSGTLRQFFEDNVIAGPTAFAVNADTFEDFPSIVLQKLFEEIRQAPVTIAGVLAASRQAELVAHSRAISDLNSRLFRLRSNTQRNTHGANSIPVYAKGAKSAKYVIEDPRRTEVYASVFYETINSDDDGSAAIPGGPIVGLPGYDTDIWGGNVGIEHSFNQNWALGGAIFASDSDTDVDDGSDVDSDRYGVAIYGSYYKKNAIKSADFYADLLYAYSQGEIETSRTGVNGLLTGDTDSDINTIEFNIGLNLKKGSCTHGPYASLTWSDGSIDAFTEEGVGGLDYSETDIESLRSRLGYQVSTVVNERMVWQVRGAWEHEFENDSITVGGLLLGSPDEDQAVLGTGFQYFINNQWRLILDYEARLSSDYDAHNILFRAGYSF